MPFEQELEAALAAADHAGQIILGLYAEWTPMADAPASIATDADRAAQDAILADLSRTFPGDAFRAEEKTPVLAALGHSGPRMWIIDPIDGTRGFAKKNGEFSVMIALAVDGRAVVGVVAEPAKNRLTYATQDAGCWRRDADESPVRVQVSRTADLSNLTLTQSHTKPDRPPTAAYRRFKPQRVLETYSAGIKLAQVAHGEADLYVCEYAAMNDWDIAAGHVLVTEAGGSVTAGDGRQLVFGQPDVRQIGGLVATNGRLHKAAIARLGDAFTAS